jgi:hypothetical protein
MGSREQVNPLVKDESSADFRLLVKDYTLVNQMIANYRFEDVEPKISKNDSMIGRDYYGIGASGAEAVTNAVAASHLTEVRRVLDCHAAMDACFAISFVSFQRHNLMPAISTQMASDFALTPSAHVRYFLNPI